MIHITSKSIDNFKKLTFLKKIEYLIVSVLLFSLSFACFYNYYSNAAITLPHIFRNVPLNFSTSDTLIYDGEYKTIYVGITDQTIKELYMSQTGSSSANIAGRSLSLKVSGPDGVTIYNKPDTSESFIEVTPINAGKYNFNFSATVQFFPGDEAEYSGNTSFTLSPCDATNADFNGVIRNLTYDGSAKTPYLDGSFTVNNNPKLVPEMYKDYDITYTKKETAESEEGINMENVIDAGYYDMNINFKGNYTGIKKIPFQIYPLNAMSAEVILDNNSFEYNGHEQKPNIESVKLGDLTLTDKDYDIFWGEDNTNVGKKNFILEFKGNFYGSILKYFDITEKDATAATIFFKPNQNEYNGKEQIPAYDIILDDTIIPKGNYDEKWDTLDFISLGKKTLNITFKNNYLGSVEGKYEITRKDASNAKVTLDLEDQVYNGSIQKPNIENVKVGDLELSTEDYTASWDTDDFKNMGTKTLTLTYKGNYVGRTAVEYKILAKDASYAEIELSQNKFEYNGHEQKPNIESIKLGDLTLTNKDYDITYTKKETAESEEGISVDNAIDAGYYDININFKGNYTGMKKIPFQIYPLNAKIAEVILDNNSFEYNRHEQKPNIESVKLGDLTLTDKDYDIFWGEDNTNVGKKFFILEFKDNFYGSISKYFNITEKDGSNAVVTIEPSEVEFNGDIQKPKVTVSLDGNNLTEQDYDEEWDIYDFQSAGTKKLTIKFMGNYEGEKQVEYKILAKDASGAEIELTQNEFEYNDKEQKPYIKSAKLGNLILTDGKDYDLIWDSEDNINVGEKSLTLEFKGNYYGKKTVSYKIVESTKTNDNQESISDENSNMSEDSNTNDENSNMSEDSSTNNDSRTDINSNVINNDSDKLEWGSKMFTKNGINHYVTDDGETSVEVTRFDKIWLYEESGGTGAWYCLDNTNGVFKIGSKFSVNWLNKGDKKYEEEYSKLDDNKKKYVDENKCELFLVSVTDPDGNKYTNFGKDSKGEDIVVNFYIQIGEDWDEKDIKALYLSTSEDEIVDASFVSMESPENKNEEFAALKLKHFSTYLVYDEVNDNEVSNNGANNIELNKNMPASDNANISSIDEKNSDNDATADKLATRAIGSYGKSASISSGDMFNYIVFIFFAVSPAFYILTFRKKKFCF